MTQLRVATYNILMGGRHGDELGRAIRAIDPAVLLVNESPKTPLLWRTRCRRLAERWNLRYVVGGRDAGSNMVVVRPDVVVKSRGAEVLRQPLFQPRRGIAWTQLKVDGRLFGVVVCHLSLGRDRRADEIRRVIEVASRLRGPVVVGGDLNEPPTGPSWAALRRAGFRDLGDSSWLTYPADSPIKRIDALTLRGGSRVRHHGHPGVSAELLARASDHRPVVLDLVLD